jgi:hypothetical protein
VRVEFAHCHLTFCFQLCFFLCYWKLLEIVDSLSNKPVEIVFPEEEDKRAVNMV